MHDTAWWSTWQGALMIGLMILIAGLLIWLIARSRTTSETSARSGGAPPAAPGSRADDAVEQARLRYARGEIDRAGYARIVQDLTGSVPETMAASAATSTADPSASAPPEAPTSEPT